MQEEGVIKFGLDHKDGRPLNGRMLRDLNGWRNRLHRLRLIGVYPNGIGYGNISRKLTADEYREVGECPMAMLFL